MNSDEPSVPEEDQLANLLASWDEALASGSDVQGAPTKMQPALKRDLAYLEIVRRALRPPSRQAEKDPATLPATTDQRGQDGASASLYRAPGELGRFQIRRELGRGGFGVVFLAYDPQLHREVALKVPREDVLITSQLLERFQREARAASGLDHPNLVPVYEAGEVGGVCFIVSAYCPGETLATWLQARQEPVPFRAAATVLATLAEAVQHAHERGVLHRDLKPSNVLLTPLLANREDLLAFTPKVTDFGLAKLQEHVSELPAGQTRSGAILGTASYMAPEQARGDMRAVGPAVDVYALGAILYELLTGRPPFRGESDLDTLLQLRTEEVVPPTRLRPKIPRDLETICLKCLRKEPQRRYLGAAALADDLDRFLEGKPIQARPVSNAERVWRWCRRNPLVASLTTAVAALLITVALVASLAALWLRQELSNTLQAEHGRRQQLYAAKVAEAQARRWSGQVGQRFESWQAVADAAGIAYQLGMDESTLLKLRNEAIASLALADVRLDKEWPGYPLGSEGTIGFDANFEHYARSDDQGNISVRRLADDRELTQLPGRGPLGGGNLINFSPKGDLLAVSYWRRLPQDPTNFRLWDWRRGTVVYQPSFPVNAMAFSRDGRSLALVQDNGTLTLVEPAAGKETRRLSLGSPMYPAFHPDGTKLALGSSAGEVQVRDVATGDLIRKLPHPTGVWTVAWHPDGDLLAAGANDTQVYLWNATTGHQRDVLRGHANNGVGVAFSPDGNLLISCAWDGTSCLWDPADGRQLVRFGGEVSHFSGDGQWLASRNGTRLSRWELAPGREYRTLPSSVRTRTRSLSSGSAGGPGGRWLAAATNEGVLIWDLATGKEKLFMRLGRTRSVTFHPSGRDLLTSGDVGLCRWPIRLGPDCLHIGPPHRLSVPGPPGGLSLDQHGCILSVVTPAGSAIVNLDQPLDRVRHFAHDNAAAVATSRDGRLVASGTHNGYGVKVWDALHGELVRVLLPDVRRSAVAFSPAGQWLVTSTQDEFALWEVASWKPVWQISRERADGILGPMAFTADGTMLALSTARNLVQLVDPATGQTFAKLQAPNLDPISWMNFCPNGSQLVVGSNIGPQGPVRVWDLRLIRAQLKEAGLDWDLPAYLPAAPLAAQQSINVELDLGELSPTHQELDKYRRAWEANPSDPNVCNNFAWFYVTGPLEIRDPTKALPLAEKAVQLAPKTKINLNTLGVVYYRLGRWDEAVATLDKCILLNDSKATAFDLFFLAMSYQQLGQPDKAKEFYHQAVRWWQDQAQLPARWVKELEAFRAEAATLLGIMVP